VDGETWAALGGILTTLIAGAWATLRKRRKGKASGGGPAFKPRARFRAYLSLRTHESDAPAPAEVIDTTPEQIPPPLPPPRIDVGEILRRVDSDRPTPETRRRKPP